MSTRPWIRRWAWPLASASLIVACATASQGQAPATPKAPAPARPPAKAAAPPAKAAAQTPKIPGPPAQVDPAMQERLDAILAQWERKSTEITALDAQFERTDNNAVWNEITEFRGRAILQAPNLVWLNHEKKADKPGPDGKAAFAFFERIICTGDTIYQCDGGTKMVSVFPLNEDARKRALEQGALPFLFNMKAAEVKKRYAMVLEKESTKAYRIRIWPLLAIDRDAFAVAVIDLNKETLLPDALHLLAPNGQNQEKFRFTAIATNKPANKANFEFKPEQWKNWKVVENPAVGDAPAPGPPAANARRTEPDPGKAAPATRRD